MVRKLTRVLSQVQIITLYLISIKKKIMLLLQYIKLTNITNT